MLVFVVVVVFNWLSFLLHYFCLLDCVSTLLLAFVFCLNVCERRTWSEALSQAAGAACYVVGHTGLCLCANPRTARPPEIHDAARARPLMKTQHDSPTPQC